MRLTLLLVALLWPPFRAWVGDLLCGLGFLIYDTLPDETMDDEAFERGRERLMRAIEEERRNGHQQ